MSAADPPYVIDLHAHFPMQFDPESQDYRGSIRRRRRGGPPKKKRERFADRFRFFVLQVADCLINQDHPGAGHAVTIDTMVQGNVGVALSVAYLPFAELDIDEPHGAPPQAHYFDRLRDLLLVIEGAVAADARVRVVKSYDELVQARADGQIALIHAVEGGFHIGGTEALIRARVAELASFGVGYVTIAHLFWRRMATNVAALPFIPDWFYHRLFPQDPGGLDDLGTTLIRELVRHRILVDITHMSEASMADTFALLDELDPNREVPVIASHIACSFGKYEYNLKQEWVEKIAERKGVCGIIYCDHYMRDGRGRQTEDFDDSFEVVKGQIARLRQWGGDDVLAIGSDLDGFIKPTLEGLDDAADHRVLAAALVGEYGAQLAAKITHGNALRVLEQGWMA